MKTNIIIRVLFSAVLTIGSIAPAVAGPDPQQNFTAVKAMTQAKSTRPGDTIYAAVPVADKDRSSLRSHAGDTRKKEFILRDNAHGQEQSELTYENNLAQVATLPLKH